MERVPYFVFLGAKIKDIKRRRAVVSLTLKPHHQTARGVAHGGVIASLLDSALGLAVISAIPKQAWCTTISLSIQYVSSGKGKLIANGRVVRKGHRTAFVVGEVRDESKHLVAIAQGVWHLWSQKPN